MKYDAEQDMNEYREEDIKNNKIRKSVEVRVVAKVYLDYWQEFENITEEEATEYAREDFLDELPRGWRAEDIEVDAIVHDYGD